MAPRAGAARARTARGGRGGGTARRRPRPEDDVPDAFRDLLSGAVGSTEVGRPLKRRKVIAKGSGVSQADNEITPARQTITDDSAESDSDVEFEDVYLGPSHSGGPDTAPADEQGPLQITITQSSSTRKAGLLHKRKPVTAAERARRLSCHKMHIVFLLYHSFHRNHWCNDTKTQATLRSFPPPRLVTMLHPARSATQTQRARLFKDALSQICDLWYVKFNITALGIRRPKWITNGDDIAQFKLPPRAEQPLELTDFRRAAKSLQGSADLGAQLFCALLRALGVDARLVTSLQPLGFTAAAELATPQKSSADQKITVYANESDEEQESHHSVSNTNNTASPTPLKRIGRLGQSRAAVDAVADLGKPPPALVTKTNRVQRPAHPVFWVEAFDDATQKWIAVDPMATKSVNRPVQLEPAFSDPQNVLSYVIAFEEGGTAKDVTRRYAKAYNAKTRKLRVDSTENGQQWLRRALKPFRKYRLQDRDQIEDADLAAKEASEGMPRNVQDFKDHPCYALERHLKRNEIIHPKQEVGRINIGTSAATRFETVYRRRDVHVVRSSDKWFRLGRQLKVGEQPLKYTRPHSVRGRNPSMGPDGEDAQTGLYALFQTDLYIPEPVVDGKISKNAFGNLDVYVPSMVPPGAVHIRAPEAKNAARLLNIDYADAVTGFQFKGRHGTAIIDGIIIASEFRAAVDAVLDGIAHAKEEAMEASRSAECLRLWRRFLVGLRVVQRVRRYGREEGEEEDRVADEEFQKELEQEMAQYRDRSPEEDGGGGFLVGAEEEDMPIRAARNSRPRLPSEDQDDDAFDDDDNYDSGGSMTEVKDQDEEEIEDHRVVLPSLAREPSLFGLEKFDIPMAVRISESEHDDYGGGGFMVDENAEDVHISRDIMTELGADQTVMQTGTLASPQHPKKKGSPTDEDTVASDQARRNSQELTKENSNTAEQPHSLELALNAASSGTLQGQFRAASNKSGAPQAEAVNETQPPQPAPAVSTAASSEFDDEMPLEDPEDEDAEPEWLL